MRYAIDVRATRSQSHFSIPTKIRAYVSLGAMGACHPHDFGKLGLALSLAPADFILILMAPNETGGTHSFKLLPQALSKMQAKSGK